MGRSMHRAEEACKKATYAPHMGEAPLWGEACTVPKKRARRQHTPPTWGKPHHGEKIFSLQVQHEGQRSNKKHQGSRKAPGSNKAKRKQQGSNEVTSKEATRSIKATREPQGSNKAIRKQQESSEAQERTQ